MSGAKHPLDEIEEALTHYSGMGPHGAMAAEALKAVGRLRAPHADPRELGGSISGPGGPRDRDAVIVDTSRALLPDNVEACAILATRNGVEDTDPSLAVVLAGKVNHSEDRASVLIITNVDGAAAIVSEILALGHRLGETFSDLLLERIRDAIDAGQEPT